MVFYLLMTVQVVVKPKVVHNRWVFLGMVFDGEEIPIWEPVHISITRQLFSRKRRGGATHGDKMYFTEYYINAGYETKTKQVFKYATRGEAQFLDTAIAGALGVPFYDYS